MKLSPDAGALLLLRVDQLSSHASQNFFCSFDVGYIRYHADHAQQFAIVVEETTPIAFEPNKSAVRGQRPISNLTSRVVRCELSNCGKKLRAVVWMDLGNELILRET